MMISLGRCLPTVLVLIGCVQIAHSGPITYFSPPGAVNTNANGVNNSGAIVGSFQTLANSTYGDPAFGGGFGFLRRPDGTYEILNVPESNNGNGYASTGAYGINNLGQIVGAYGTTASTAGAPTTSLAFLRDADGLFTPISMPGYTQIGASDINDSGDMVLNATSSVPVRTDSFVRSDGTYTQLLNGSWRIVATSINNAGYVAGSYTVAGEVGCAGHGFLYEAGAYTSFDVPGACQTNVSGMNDAGEIVGITHFSDGSIYQPFLRRTDGTYTLLDLASALLGPDVRFANDINQSDVVVGATDGFAGFWNVGYYGTVPLEPAPVPEPASFFPCVVVLAGMLLRSRMT